MKLKDFLKRAMAALIGQHTHKNVPLGLGVFISHGPHEPQVTCVTPAWMRSGDFRWADYRKVKYASTIRVGLSLKEGKIKD
jgi:hypothetical protein